MASSFDPRRTVVLDITTVLWDLGGVVLNFEPAPRLAVLAADCGLSEDEVFARVWGAGLSNDWDRGLYANESMYDAVRRAIGLKMRYERFLQVMISAFRVNRQLLPVIDAVPPEVRQAGFSNNPRHLLEAMPVSFPGSHRTARPPDLQLRPWRLQAGSSGVRGRTDGPRFSARRRPLHRRQRRQRCSCSGAWYDCPAVSVCGADRGRAERAGAHLTIGMNILPDGSRIKITALA